ncbi:MAG: diguanylate cyclase [Clostridium sp.]
MFNQYKSILEHIHAGVLHCKNDQYSTINYANDYFYEMIGYTREEIEKNHNNRFADFVVDDVSAILVTIDEKIANNEDLDFEFRMQRKDGSIFWVHDTAKYDRENNCWFVTIMDITEMKSLNYERERLEFYLNSIPNKIVISDDQGEVIYKNKEAEECSYYNQNAETLKEMIGDNILGRNFDDIFNLAVNGFETQFETRHENDGKFIGHDQNHLVMINTREKERKYYMLVSEDVFSKGDFLTGYPSRLMFENYYEFYMASYPNTEAYLCIIDIDDFKHINDTYGHNVGDLAIKQTAERIASLLDEEDYVCRYGGDEFLIFSVNKSVKEVLNKLKLFLGENNKKMYLGDICFTITYSVGLASVKGCFDYHEAFAKADQALYQVKANGKNQIIEYIEKDLKV